MKYKTRANTRYSRVDTAFFDFYSFFLLFYFCFVLFLHAVELQSYQVTRSRYRLACMQEVNTSSISWKKNACKLTIQSTKAKRYHNDTIQSHLSVALKTSKPCAKQNEKSLKERTAVRDETYVTFLLARSNISACQKSDPFKSANAIFIR